MITAMGLSVMVHIWEPIWGSQRKLLEYTNDRSIRKDELNGMANLSAQQKMRSRRFAGLKVGVGHG